MDLQTVDAHRGEVNAITTLAQDDLRAYATTIAQESPVRVAEQLREVTPAVIETYGDVSATSGALFYENNRPVAGYAATLATPALAPEIGAMVGFAVAPLFAEEINIDLFLSRLLGGTQKFVAQYDRDTIALNSDIDADLNGGYTRFARANACAFCAYLSSQDIPVFSDHDKWHNDCKCVQVPWWDDNPLPANPNRERWADAASLARSAIEADFVEKRKLAPNLRKRSFYKQFPETAINTKNIAARMRNQLGLAH